MDYVIRAVIAFVPVVALTVVGRQLGYRGVWLAVPGLLTVLFTIFWSLALIKFVLGGAPVTATGFLKAMVPGLQQAVWSAVTIILVLLAIFGVSPAVKSPTTSAE